MQYDKPSREDNWPFSYTTQAAGIFELKAKNTSFSPATFSLLGLSMNNHTSAARVLGILGENVMGAANFAKTADNYLTSPTGFVNVLATQDFAFECLFRIAAIPASPGPFVNASAGGTVDGFTVGVDASGYLTVTVGDGTTVVTAVNDTDVCDNEWHHMMLIFNRLGADGTLTLYLDGAEVDDSEAADEIGVVGGASQTIIFLGITSSTATTHLAAPAMYASTTTATGAFSISNVITRYNSGVFKRHTGAETGILYYWKAIWGGALYPSGTTPASGTVAYIAFTELSTNNALEYIPIAATTFKVEDFPQSVPYSQILLIADGAGVTVTLHGFSN